MVARRENKMGNQLQLGKPPEKSEQGHKTGGQSDNPVRQMLIPL